ncbi:MAG: hypothetical protein GY800_08960 [Planctomycetes bacterium]|nr:hypothetical protein [Planctomycetota bacterium]
MKSIDEQIKELAESMGVSETDLRALATSAVNSIKRDGAKEAYLAESEENQTKLAEAYASDAVRKNDSFVTTYLTNSAARKGFQESVLNAM